MAAYRLGFLPLSDPTTTLDTYMEQLTSEFDIRYLRQPIAGDRPGADTTIAVVVTRDDAITMLDAVLTAKGRHPASAPHQAA